ncbi:MAG TPA: helix-turn-helix domain-containing protein [Anaerolineales bacterium]|nr:helix-turn-helix domain-containing protein [Anaerolineales bacterium]
MVFTTNEKYEQAILSTLLYVQSHLESHLTLETLAGRAGFSPYHFHRIFRDAIGEPIKEYIRRLRMDRAAYRLKISEETILRIAVDAGFRTHESFTRAFQRQFGIPPNEFRRNFLQASRARKKQLPPRYMTEFHLEGEPDLLANGSTSSQVRLEQVRPIIVAFVRHVGPYDRLLDPGSPMSLLWQELFDWGNANRLINADSLLIGIPQDDPSITPPEKQRFDVCVQIPEFRNPSGHIGCQTIAAGTFGVGRHYGPFDDLADTYMHVYDTLITTGKCRLRTQAPFEVYSYSTVKGDIRIHFTDVYLPVEPVKKHNRKQEGSL